MSEEIKNELNESVGEIEYPAPYNADANKNTLQWKNIIADINSCNSTFEKIIVLLRLNQASDSPELRKRYGGYGLYLSELIIEEGGAYCDESLVLAINKEFEGLDTSDKLDNFLFKIEQALFQDMTIDKKEDLITHYVGKVLYHPINKFFLQTLPKDSSKLDVWYVLGKHFLKFKDILTDVAEVYGKNKNFEESRKFYEEYVIPSGVEKFFNRMANNG